MAEKIHSKKRQKMGDKTNEQNTAEEESGHNMNEGQENAIEGHSGTSSSGG